MSKRMSTVEWVVMESNADWERLCMSSVADPLLCDDLDRALWHLRWKDSPHPLVHLDQLAVPAALDLTEYGYPLDRVQPSHPGQTIAVVTLIDYTVIAYGREHLPALVAGLGQHTTWETLVPTVFGISAAEFEAGWQAYLAAQYGL